MLVMAAAPADFRTEPVTGKIKRQDSLNLNLQPTEDILAAIAAERGEDQTVIGFAAEHGGDAVARARAKLARKGADVIVLNDVSDPEIGFESAENEVTLVAATDEIAVPRASKDAVADAILDRDRRLRAAGANRPCKRAVSVESQASYTGFKLFCPYLYRAVEKWAWPTFFTAQTGQLPE